MIFDNFVELKRILGKLNKSQTCSGARAGHPEDVSGSGLPWPRGDVVDVVVLPGQDLGHLRLVPSQERLFVTVNVKDLP